MLTQLSSLLPAHLRDVEPKAPVPFEESQEYRDMLAERMRIKTKAAGIFGAYATADSDLGKAAYDRAKQGRGSYFFGPCGTGKTYAAATAVRLAIQDGKTAKLYPTMQLLEDIKRSWDTHENSPLDRACEVDLLVLDDLGAERSTEWAVEKISTIIDSRTMAGNPTIITSNYRLGQLRDRWGAITGARIASRIAGACERIEVEGKDRRWQ